MVKERSSGWEGWGRVCVWAGEGEGRRWEVVSQEDRNGIIEVYLSIYIL